jgi:hypothetical protein
MSYDQVVGHRHHACDPALRPWVDAGRCTPAQDAVTSTEVQWLTGHRRHRRRRSVMHRRVAHLFLHGLSLALPLVLFADFSVSGPTQYDIFATTDSTFPVIAHIAASQDRPGDVIIAGHGFTPGHPVYIVIHDLWGTRQHENRWVTASEISYQPPPDLPPGEGFSFDTGGNIATTFHIDIEPAVVPGDSQNPALGPVTSSPTTMAGVDCATSLMVMAYDRTTAVWSDTVGITLGCSG